MSQMNQIKKEKISFSQKFENNYIKEKDKEYFSLEDSINKYDHNNLFLLDQANDKEYGNMEDYLDLSYKITPPELQESYGQKVLEIIDSINPSKTPNNKNPKTIVINNIIKLINPWE